MVESGHSSHGGLGHRVLPPVHGGPCQRSCTRLGTVRRRGASNGQWFRTGSSGSQERDAVQRAAQGKGSSRPGAR